MDRRGPEAWNPERTWADPFIATLALLIILVVGTSHRAREARPQPPPDRADLQGRLADLALAAPRILGSLAGATLAPKEPVKAFLGKTGQGWDRAVLAVHAGLSGDLVLGAKLSLEAPGATGEAFRRAWTWAFQGTGAPPEAATWPKVRKALGDGYAADLLEAHCVGRSGGDPHPLETQGANRTLPRLVALVFGSLGALALLLAGLGFLFWQSLTKAPDRLLPRFRMSGRAALIVLLGWFATHLAAGLVIGPAVAGLPFLRPVALPLTYLFHALLGTAYLCLAEGISLGTLVARLVPGGNGRALAMGLGFFALAFTAVVAVAMVLSPFLPGGESPQRELMEVLTRLRGPIPVFLMFLTIAVVAPVFEELLFRGFLLPWLGERLEPRLGRTWGWVLALGVSGLTFGAMHLQPLGLPTLTTLGLVLGFAFLRTGNLLTAILVHGLWNGGIFILMRALA